MASVELLHIITTLMCLVPLSLSTEAGERHVKFQYKHSFKGPHLVNKEGNIPFWTHGGSKWSFFVGNFIVYTCTAVHGRLGFFHVILL